MEKISLTDFIGKCNQTQIIITLEGRDVIHPQNNIILHMMDYYPRMLFKKPRQIGLSTCAILYAIYQLLFNDDCLVVGMMSRTMTTARECDFLRFKQYLQEVIEKFDIKDDVAFIINNRKTIEIQVNQLNKKVQSFSANGVVQLRNRKIDLLIGDEIAFFDLKGQKIEDFCIYDDNILLSMLLPSDSYDVLDVEYINKIINKFISKFAHNNTFMKSTPYLEKSKIISEHIKNFWETYKENIPNAYKLLNEIIYIYNTDMVFYNFIEEIISCSKKIILYSTETPGLNLFNYMWGNNYPNSFIFNEISIPISADVKNYMFLSS